PLDPGAPPRLIAPEADVTAYEGGLRFAWTPAAGTSRHVLVISTQPFDPRHWTRAIGGPDFTVVETSRPVVSLSETGLGIDRDTRLYWAAGSARSATGPLSFSEARAIQVIRKFRNSVQPSPYLESSPIGRAAPVTDREPDRIRLAAGYTIDPAIGEPALPEAMRRSVAPDRGARTVLMFYGDADPASARESIMAAGGEVVAYIPDRSFLVRLKGDAPFSPAVARWVGAYQPAYKVSPDLDRQPGLPYRMTVLAFPDADVEALRLGLEGAGARVLAQSSNGLNKIFRIEAPGSASTALANLEDVAWIEPYVQPTVDNSSVQWLVQTFATSNRRLWDLGIRGEGQIIHHSDSGIGMTHEMFNDGAVPLTGFGDYPTHRKVVRYEKGSPDPNIAFGDHTGASLHGSHTSGTAAGNDLTAPFSGFDGVAKFARIWHSDLGGPALGSGIAPPLDLNDLFQPSFTGNAAGAARVSTNSWGGNSGGAYTVDAANADEFMWNHPDYLICFANGNAGGFNTVGSPASAKNMVSVGGTGNGSTASARLIYSSTSRGPTDDGRRKPTICSPASSVTSAQTAPASYGGLSGTSMASPNTAGTAVLFRQYCQEGWYPTGTKVPANGFSPSAALLKAMLVNSGVNDITSFVAPDNNVGYGRICADTVLYFSGDAKRLLLVDQTEGLGHGEQIEYKVNVVNDLTSLEVALCWTDFPASVSSGLQLVNNLNLTVTNGVLTYRGNVYVGGFGVTGGSYDVLNVEEAVLVRFPAVGVWTIRVEGANVPAGPQPFGLAISGGVGVTAGALALDRASYGSSSLVEVQVTDTDAGGSINVT
ncbi:MAG: S8 family serine peptidase, partial [Gemmatimonadales bacterium]